MRDRDKKKIVGYVIITISILYFLWLLAIILSDLGYFFLLDTSLERWIFVGIALYSIFTIIMISFLYTPKEEEESFSTTQVGCSKCKTIFKIKGTGERPLAYSCPNCGREGSLKGRIATAKRSNITCDNCGEKFDIWDEGTRPLNFECPRCHLERIIS